MKNTPVWFQYPKFNWKNKHAIIIGGGIAGCQMAWHLCEQGWQVTLIERHDKLASEASGNPAGVISPKMTATQSIGEDFYTQSFCYTVSLLDDLKQQGHIINWQKCGVLQLAHNPREVKRWHSLKDRNLPSDFIQLLNEDETMQVAGIKLHPDHQYKSSYFPKGGWINPASFCKALTHHSNCKIIHQTEAISLEKVGAFWQVMDSSNTRIEQSEVIIIANGKDLFDFTQSEFLPGMPVAGQTTSAKASVFSRKLKTVIGHEGYLTPAIKSASATHHTFGATFKRGINIPSIDPEADNENFKKLKQYLPSFTNSLNEKESAHVAVRMTTPDRLPYVGCLPDSSFYQQNYDDLHQGRKWKKYPKAKYQDGLFVLGGLGSRGLISSGLCAKTLVDLLENKLESEQSTLLINCHPARFIVKALKKRL